MRGIVCLSGLWCLVLAVAPMAAEASGRGPGVAKGKVLQSEGLVVDLRPGGPCRGEGPVTMRFRVSNPTRTPRTFCIYHTPFEGIRNDIFTLTTAEGAARSYQGMMAKRAAPGPEHFLTLKPGEERSVDVDLREGYRLEPGSYRVAFSGNAISGLPGSGAVSVVVEGAPRSLTSLEVEPVNFAEGPVSLRFTVRNPTQEPLRICRYYTPLEGLLNDFMDLRTAAGGPVRFTAPLASRPAPGPADYVSLAPGATVEGRVDLRQYYALPPGEYVVGFPGNDDCAASAPVRFRVVGKSRQAR